MTLFDHIERLTRDKEAIRTSLNEKGCNIGEEVSLDDYANIITNSDLGSGSTGELLLKDYPITYKLDGDTFLVKDKEALKQYTYQYYRIHYKDLVLNTLENDLILTEDYNANILITENSLFEHNIDERTIKYNGKTCVCINDLEDYNDLKIDYIICYNYFLMTPTVSTSQYFEVLTKETNSYKTLIAFNLTLPKSGYDLSKGPNTYQTDTYCQPLVSDKNENNEWYAAYKVKDDYYCSLKTNGVEPKQPKYKIYVHITD